MISNQAGTMIIDGVSLSPTPVYKGFDGTLSQATYAVANGAGGYEGVIAAAIVGTPSVFFIAAIELSSMFRYNLSGVTSPGETTVYISEGLAKGSVSTLTRNIIAHTQSDANGNFSITDIPGIDGAVSVWMRVAPEYAQTGGISCTAEVCESHTISATDIFVQKLRYAKAGGHVCSACEGAGCNVCEGGLYVEPIFRFIGTCPEDASTLCLSKVPSARRCQTCMGAGYIVTGTETCPSCNGQCYPTMTCEVCSGNGTVDGVQCDTCYGSGFVSAGSGMCATCAGTGTVDTTEQCSSCGGSMATISGSDEEIAEISGSDYLLSSVSVSNGVYEVEGMIGQDELLLLWTTSQTGGEITIDSTSISEGHIKCLSGDTMITMADGSARQLQMLQIGDMVMSGDGSPTRVHSVARGKYHPSHTMYEFEDGTVIDEVSTHRFYNADQGFFQHLKKWKLGEHAVNRYGAQVAMIRKEQIDEEKEMFGLWTEQGTYYANGLLSGPATCNHALLADATAEQAVDMMLSIEEAQLLRLIGLEELLP